MQALTNAFRTIEQRWPSVGFLSLGLIYGWLDVQTSSFVLFSTKTSSSIVNLDQYLFFLTLFIVMFVFLGALLHRQTDISFGKLPMYFVSASLLTASVVLSKLLDQGFLPPEFLYLNTIMSGMGVAWLLIGCAHAYARLEVKEILVYTGLSKVIGVLLYFVTIALPVAGSIVVLAITPCVAAGLLYSVSPARKRTSGESEKEDPRFRGQGSSGRASEKLAASNLSKMSLIKLGLVCFMLFFIAALTKLTPLAYTEHVDTIMSYHIINVGTLVFCFLYVLVVIAFTKWRRAIITKGFYLAMAVILVFFIATPLVANQTPAISWISGSLRNLLDAIVFALACIVIKRTQISTAQIYGLIGGLHSLGSFSGHALVGTLMLGGTVESYYVVLGINLAAAVLLFVVFTPRDLEYLLSLNDSDFLESKTSQSQSSIDVSAMDTFVTTAGLSQREIQVFQFLSRGYTSQMIARELSISQSTVKTHISKIYAKIGVSTREEFLIKTNNLMS